MRENFDGCLSFTLGFEGGFSSDRRDPGNWTGGKVGKGVLKGTNKGVSAAAYPSLDIKNLSPARIGQIYRSDYWDKVSGDKLAAGVDLVTFDGAVHSGVSRSLKWLMASIGGTDVQTVKKYCAKRLSFQQTLAIWKIYKNGFIRRVAASEAKGVAWAWAEKKASPATIQAGLLDEQNAAAKKSKARELQAQGSGVVGAGSSVGATSISPEHIDQLAGWILGGLVVAGFVVAGLLIIRSIIHKHRAEAYAAEAAGME